MSYNGKMKRVWNEKYQEYQTTPLSPTLARGKKMEDTINVLEIYYSQYSPKCDVVGTALSSAISELQKYEEMKKRVSVDNVISALHKWDERWLLCWGGEPDGSCFDCACCIDGKSDKECQCICHHREKDLAQAIVKLSRRSAK